MQSRVFCCWPVRDPGDRWIDGDDAGHGCDARVSVLIAEIDDFNTRLGDPLPARASCSTYTPEAAPLFMLLRALAARPSARSLVIEVPGLRVALHAGPSFA
jgi:hypothetical protein